MDEDDDKDPSLLKWLTAIGAVAGAAGAVLFSLQRFAYERFYEEFALTPEDAGISSGRVVTAAAFALVATTVVCFVVVALLSLSTPSLRKPRTMALAALALVGVLLVTWLGIAWSQADDAAECLAREDGQPVRELRIGIGSVETGIVGIRAERATVDWIAQEPAPEGLDGSEAVFLGQVDGTALLYVPARRRTLRVPASAVAVEIDATAERFDFDDGCQPTS